MNRLAILAAEIFFEQSEIPFNGDQRTLQIVGYRVSKSLQLGILDFKFLNQSLTFELGLLSLRNIRRNRRHLIRLRIESGNKEMLSTRRVACLKRRRPACLGNGSKKGQVGNLALAGILPT